MTTVTTPPGLTEAQLDTVRTALTAGRKPKVQFTASAGQIAGTVGQVVGLDDETDDDEWIVVRFGKDELPFAPGDLQLLDAKSASAAKAPRGAGPTRSSTEMTSPTQGKATTNVSTESALQTPEVSQPAADAPVAVAPTPTPSDAAQPAPISAESDDEATDAASKPAEKPSAKGRRGRPAKQAGVAELSVILNYGDGQWTVESARSGKPLVKATPVRPSEALKIVALLEDPSVQEAVDEIVESARAEAEAQAERLRQQLAAIEATIADLSTEG